MSKPTLLCCVLVLFIATAAQAQDLTVYDDALQNSFQDYSYGGVPSDFNFSSTAQVHGGTYSIAFIGNSFNALSFARPSGALTTAAYPVLRFWIHGGAAGNQQLVITLQLGVNIVKSAELDTYIAGGAAAAGAWREVTVTFANGPLSYSGSFDRIDLQSGIGGGQPVLYIDDMTLGQVAAQPSNTMNIEQGVTVASMVSDRFTWQDSSNQPRVAVLAHNDTAAGPGGSRGGALREFRYQLPNGSTRIANVTTYGNAGYGGFGYVVSHASRYAGCVGDDSPLGGFIAGTWTRVFEGPHHAIFRFSQNYPRNCSTTNPVVARTIPVTIDWMFATGHDHPLWAITWNIDQTSPAAPVNTFYDDTRAPYGEFNIDGQGAENLDGTAWGDRWKFTTTSAPISVNSSWTWNAPNTVPYVKEWIAGPLTVNNTRDATMGLVQTQTLDQQDAGGARDPGVGSDIRPYWNKTSANGNACGVKVMPCGDDWPYQANGNSIEFGANNARLTWKTQYGFIGQSTYTLNNDGVATTAPGYPKKSYSTYIVLGTHTTTPVETQVTQVETMQTVTLSTTTGSVATSGPAGVTRADTVTYAPPGYDHVYGALTFVAAANQLDANIAIGAGSLKKPLVIVRNFTAGYPTIKLGGATLVSDTDYFASLRAAASELWITLNRDLTGATNHLEIVSIAAPSAPQNVVATAVNSTRIDIAWTAFPGAASYEVDRRAPGGGFTPLATPVTNAFSDTTATADTAYLYRVRAVTGTVSDNSAPDLATTVIFTDPALAGLTVQAVHLTQLRTAVNAVQTLAGQANTAYTDPAPTGLPIKAVHVTELRNRLDSARVLLGLSNSAYTDPALAGIAVRGVHLQEPRDRVQ